MREAGGGSIINVSSSAGMLGLSGTPGAVAYTATKAGLQGLTLSVAADHAAEGIRANCLIVGTVYTPLVAVMGEEGRERRRKAVPLQTEGTGWDVAYAAVYLASDEFALGHRRDAADRRRLPDHPPLAAVTSKVGSVRPEIRSSASFSLREKVSPKATDEGSTSPGDWRSPGKSIASVRPLIRRAPPATFSRRGRRTTTLLPSSDPADLDSLLAAAPSTPAVTAAA